MVKNDVAKILTDNQMDRFRDILFYIKCESIYDKKVDVPSSDIIEGLIAVTMSNYFVNKSDIFNRVITELIYLAEELEWKLSDSDRFILAGVIHCFIMDERILSDQRDKTVTSIMKLISDTVKESDKHYWKGERVYDRSLWQEW